MADVKQCACGTKLGDRNTSGRCQPCGVAHHNGLLETKAKRASSMKRVWQRPEYRANHSAKMKARCARPEVIERLRQHAKKIGLQRMGVEAMRNPALIAKRSLRGTLTKMAWCPPHLIDDARELRRAGYRLAEIKEIIAERDEAEKEQIRKVMGASHA